jgi:hypothetical protein
MTKQFTITKRIAKHGNQAIIVIPKLIEQSLKPGTIVEVRIEVLEPKYL